MGVEGRTLRAVGRKQANHPWILDAESTRQIRVGLLLLPERAQGEIHNS